MAGSLNKVMLIGNLGADPEVRNLPNGGKVVNMTIATSETWRDKNTGEKKEKTEWHRIVVFNEGLVKVIEQYLHKGDKVYLEGQLQTRKWTDQAGVEKYSTEVVLANFGGTMTMLQTKGDGDGGQRSSSQQSKQNNPPRQSSQPAFDGGMDDDIPF